MQTILTTDTINQGRVKANDAIDHIITGATTSTSPGTIDFHSNSGLYDFSGTINLPNAYEGGIIDGMWITQDLVNPLTWNIAAGTYIVGGNVYSYAGGSVTCANTTIAGGRLDTIFATNTGTVQLQQGTETLTASYNETDNIPLAVIAIARLVTSASAPYQVCKLNMNFKGGRMIATGDTASHSIDGLNGTVSNYGINMSNFGWLNSDFSYIFGGIANINTGVTFSGSFKPANGIYGGRSNRIGGSTSSYSTIIGSSFSTIERGNECGILFGSSSNITFTGATTGVRCHMVAATSSLIDGTSLDSKIGFGNGHTIRDTSSSEIIGGDSNTVNSSDLSTLVGGGENLLYTGYYCEIIGGQSNQVFNSNYSVVLNCQDSFFTGQTSSSFINTISCTGFTNSNNGNLMLNCDFSSISEGTQDSGLILTSYSHLSGASSNSAVLGGRDANITASDFTTIIGGSYNVAKSSSNLFVTGNINSGITANAGFIFGDKNLINGSANSAILGGSGNTVTSSSSMIINGLNTSLSTNSNHVAINTNTYASASLPTYTTTVDNFSINKSLMYGVDVQPSGSTNAGSRVVQAVNPTGGASTSRVYLPASPYDGQFIVVKDAQGTAGAGNTLKVDGNGKNVDGGSSATISTAYGSISVVFSSSFNKWLII